MSSRRIFRAALRSAAAQFRGLAMLAVAAKLLVPVGYMPASFADGGPFVLCGSGLTAAIAPVSQAEHESHGHGSAAHDHTVSSREAAASTHSGAGTGHDHGEEPVAGHHEWERCSLGGLASLAALSVEWHFDIQNRAPASAAIPRVAFFSDGASVAFRSRAPPVAVS